MKKSPVVLTVVLPSFGILVALLLISCSPKGHETLYGTWVNSSGTGIYNWTFFPGGTSMYTNKDGSIKTEGRVVIAKKWIDAKGYTWYMISTKYHIAPYKELGSQLSYTLMKIDPSGKTMETDSSREGYPKEFFGPAGTGAHQIFQRQ
jgi:hypothetical protein